MRVGARTPVMRVGARSLVVFTLVVVACDASPELVQSQPPWRAPRAVLVSRLGNLERPLTYNGASDVSRSGRFVVFDSLVEGERELTWRILLHDTQRETVTLVAAGSSGDPPEPEPPFRWATAEISADGRYVVFDSPSTDLVPRDRNQSWDAFIYDRVAAKFTLVSRSSRGEQGDRGSYEPTISAHGRFVAFTSHATNLDVDDTIGADVFVHDRRTGKITVITYGTEPHGPAGAAGKGDSGSPSISADGSRVAFLSRATDIVPGDTNRAVDAFVHDVSSGATQRVSVTSEGEQLEPFEYAESADVFREGAEQPQISGDGKVVVFSSHANGLVAGDDNNMPDIFTHELNTGGTERVSVPTGGGDGYRPEDRECGQNGQCFPLIRSHSPSISHDGRYVAFLSGAPQLHPGELDARHQTDDVFVHDRKTMATLLVNRRPDGSPARDVELIGGSISPDGRWVTYTSNDNRIAPGDSSGDDIFLQRLPQFDN